MVQEKLVNDARFFGGTLPKCELLADYNISDLESEPLKRLRKERFDMIILEDRDLNDAAWASLDLPTNQVKMELSERVMAHLLAECVDILNSIYIR